MNDTSSTASSLISRDPILADADYPRVYRPTTGWSSFCIGLGLVVLIPGILGTFYFGSGRGNATPAGSVIFGLISFGFALLGCYMIGDILLSKLILHANAIEFRHFLSDRKLLLDDIASRRMRRTRNSPAVLILSPHNSSLKKLKVPEIFRADQVLATWLKQIPDGDAEVAKLAAEALRQSEAEIAATAKFGTTPEQRLARLNGARKLARIMHGVVVGVGLWCWVYPRPYEFAVTSVAVLPWLAILLVVGSRGLFRINTRQNDAHPNLAYWMIAPGIILTLRALQDVHLFDWPQTLPIAAAAAIGMLLLMTIADPGLRQPLAFLIFLPFVLVYTDATAVLANALLDRARPEIFDALVVSKHISTGKHTTWYLRLAPWGPMSEPDDVSVSRDLYGRIDVGGSACVRFHKGALGFAWFIPGACQNAIPGPNATAELAEIGNLEVSALRQRANAGDAIAANELGVRLSNGNGVRQDYTEAAHWFRIAADHGNPIGEHNLGVFYQRGWGVLQDYGTAADLYRRSEDADPDSAAELGYLYETGHGVAKDLNEARRHYEVAATHGVVSSAVNLATMYSFGRGVQVDFPMAFHWYMEAAKKGDPRAMNGVGYSYLNGLGVEKDTKQGIAWLTAAADAGQPNAMHTLGGIWLAGTLMPSDPTQAYRWLLLATRTYSSDDEKLPAARAALAKATLLLTEQQRATIDSAVAAWKPVPGHPPSQ